MYKLSSNNDWFDGMKFDSLGEAVEKAKAHSTPAQMIDVLRRIDRDTYQVVWTQDSTEYKTVYDIV